MGGVVAPDHAPVLHVERADRRARVPDFCGRCEEVCPVRIPLPRMMRSWREREFERHLSPATVRSGLAFWAFFAKRPWLYGLSANIGARLLALLGRSRGRFRWLPLASGWTRFRDFPAPEGATFQAQWKARERAAATPAAQDTAR